MTSNCKFMTHARLLASLISPFLLAGASCRAQAMPPERTIYVLGANGLDSAAAPASALIDQPPAADPTASSPAPATVEYPEWHFSVSPYLWFPGVHGTVGAGSHDASVHASPGDVLSHFRFGLMGAMEGRYKRLVLPLDIMWVRLGDDKALPGPNLGAATANVIASEFILTPKIGFRVVDQEKLKIDALTGFRYWHLGQNLQFSPSILGLNISGSQNWVDPLVGGRIEAAPSSRIVVNILGDVGGWGAGSQLDYQVVGILGYRIKPKWTLQAGYRYLDVNYRSGRTIFDTAMGGAMFGVSIALK
jgi:hypothetical protein